MIMIPSSTAVIGGWAACGNKLSHQSVLRGSRYRAWLSCKASRRCL